MLQTPGITEKPEQYNFRPLSRSAGLAAARPRSTNQPHRQDRTNTFNNNNYTHEGSSSQTSSPPQRQSSTGSPVQFQPINLDIPTHKMFQILSEAQQKEQANNYPNASEQLPEIRAVQEQLRQKSRNRQASSAQKRDSEIILQLINEQQYQAMGSNQQPSILSAQQQQQPQQQAKVKIQSQQNKFMPLQQVQQQQPKLQQPSSSQQNNPSSQLLVEDQQFLQSSALLPEYPIVRFQTKLLDELSQLQSQQMQQQQQQQQLLPSLVKQDVIGNIVINNSSYQPSKQSEYTSAKYTNQLQQQQQQQQPKPNKPAQQSKAMEDDGGTGTVAGVVDTETKAILVKNPDEQYKSPNTTIWKKHMRNTLVESNMKMLRTERSPLGGFGRRLGMLRPLKTEETERTTVHVKKERMYSKNNISNNSSNPQQKQLSYFTSYSPNDDFPVFLDSQNYKDIDRDSLIIRMQILESEIKETKCHSLRLSDKYRELLDEYRRFKEYQDGIDRKSLYQKHVARLSELSKQCFDQNEELEKRNNTIQQLQGEIASRDAEVSRVNEILAGFELGKQQEMQKVESNYQEKISELQVQIELLKKESMKVGFLEKSYKELVEKTTEEKKRMRESMQEYYEQYTESNQRKFELEEEVADLKAKVNQLEDQCERTENEKNDQLKSKDQECMLALKKMVQKHTEETNAGNDRETKLKTTVKDLQGQIEELNQHIMSEEVRTQYRTQQLQIQLNQAGIKYDTYQKAMQDAHNKLQEDIKLLQQQLKESNQHVEELQEHLLDMAEQQRAMQDKHESELNELYKQRTNEQNSLNFKIKELKLQHEVEIERVQLECQEKVISCVSESSDAQRQIQALKNSYGAEMDAKATEIAFLKNKIFEEKRKLKEQIEDAHKESIRDLLKKVDFLTAELESQKNNLENNICEDLANYGKNSKYWKRGKEIRDEKSIGMSVGSEETSKERGMNSNMAFNALNNANQAGNQGNNKKQSYNQQEYAKLRFSIIARCASAFEKQQDKVDSLRQQLDVLQHKTSKILKKQLLLQKTAGNQQGNSGNGQKQSGQNNGNIGNNLEGEDGDLNEDLLEGMQFEDTELKELELAKKIGELVEEMHKLKVKLSEKEETYQAETKARDAEEKNLRGQLESLNQVKVQTLFSKDIIIEKQTGKLAEMRMYVGEAEEQIQKQVVFVEKMKEEVELLKLAHKKVVEELERDKEELMRIIREKQETRKEEKKSSEDGKGEKVMEGNVKGQEETKNLQEKNGNNAPTNKEETIEVTTLLAERQKLELEAVALKQQIIALQFALSNSQKNKNSNLKNNNLLIIESSLNTGQDDQLFRKTISLTASSKNESPSAVVGAQIMKNSQLLLKSQNQQIQLGQINNHQQQQQQHQQSVIKRDPTPNKLKQVSSQTIFEKDNSN